MGEGGWWGGYINMIKIIEPEEYKLIKKSDDTPHDHTSQDEEEEDLEVEVVNTEEKGNKQVYKLTNSAFILLLSLLAYAYYTQPNQRN